MRSASGGEGAQLGPTAGSASQGTNMSPQSRPMRSAVFFGLTASAVILAAMSVRDARQSGTDLTKRSDRSVAAASQGTQRHLAARTDQEADTLREPPAAHRQGSPHLASPYYTDQIIVAPARGQSLAGVARHLGGTIERTPGRSGYGVIRLPEGTSVADALGQVQAAGLIDGAAPNGRMVGAGKPKTPPLKGPQRFQWHRKAARMRAKQQDAPVADLSEWVVAVLDTGVAYEQYADDDHTYVPAGSLSGSAIVAPYDFVNDDAHANDDHQHGTHIASVIASSDDGAVLGQLEGMAPGASLMPIKVLDENNVGSEFALMEAIYHAVDNEADVINMSLSFHPDYVPSVALNEALEAASRAGILMVAASGNDGLGAATWPAASPLVVGVGSAAPTNDKNELVAAHYSNLAPSVDIVAPGGSLDADLNEDGQIDGILGQTIRLNHPEEMGYWFYAGTSQAAAVVSGALVQLLETGATPSVARNALLLGAADDVGDRWSSGTGAGSLNLDESLKLIEDEDEALVYEGRLHVAVMPVLYARSESKVMPVASVTVLDDDGLPVEDITAWVAFTGSVDQMASCKTDEVGWCYATASEIEWLNTDTMQASPVGVAAEVSTVTTSAGIPVHPTPLAYVQGELEVMLAGMAAEPALDGAALTIHWTPTQSDRSSRGSPAPTPS